MRPMQSEVYHAQVALDIIDMDIAHSVNGRCDRPRISDAIFLGIYACQLKPMNEMDVAYICDLLDALLNSFKNLEEGIDE